MVSGSNKQPSSRHTSISAATISQMIEELQLFIAGDQPWIHQQNRLAQAKDVLFNSLNGRGHQLRHAGPVLSLWALGVRFQHLLPSDLFHRSLRLHLADDHLI